MNFWEFCQAMTLSFFFLLLSSSSLLLFGGWGRETAIVHLAICCSSFTQTLQIEKPKFSCWFCYSDSKTNSLNSLYVGNTCHRLCSYFGGHSLQNQSVILKLYVVEVFLLSLPQLPRFPEKNAFSQHLHSQWPIPACRSWPGSGKDEGRGRTGKGQSLCARRKPVVFLLFSQFSFCSIL